MAKPLTELLKDLDRGIAALISDMKQERPSDMTETELVAAATGFLLATGVKVASENDCNRVTLEAIIKETLDKTYVVPSEVLDVSSEGSPPTPRDGGIPGA